ncbi:hypothetical protein [Paludisphaera soli]|uniref:hypothetical protein n=1 Tax=Paludisphaera soli TaxID=2712865 RepID=UPI0013EA2F3B|nr:hypothetical protein [Paludisphaera soli]
MVALTRTIGGFEAHIEAKGRLALEQYRPFSGGVGTESTWQPEQDAYDQTPRRSELVIDSSGNWVLLHDHFFNAKSVRQSGSILTVVVPSNGSEDDAALQAIRAPRRGRDDSIAYAHRNDALIVAVEHVESESAGEGLDWTVRLRPKDIEYGGRSTESATQVDGRHFTADDIAELRARRILLNDPPPPTNEHRHFDDAALLEIFIQGTGAHLPVERCIIRDLYSQFSSDPALYLRLARLAAIFALKAGDVVEQVTRLALGPIADGGVQVAFRGRRRKKYTNRDPHVIEFEGVCPLS